MQPETLPARKSPQLALRLCLQEDGDNQVPCFRELPESWNLMKAMHQLQGAKQAAFAQALVETWSLSYSFLWTGSDFASVLREAKNDMEAS